MKYVLMSFESSEDFATRTNPETRDDYWENWGNYFKRMEAVNILVSLGAILQSGKQALTVRSDSEPVTGAYCKGNEQFSGYWVIDVTDLNQAIKWANQAPAASKGAVEIRSVWE